MRSSLYGIMKNELGTTSISKTNAKLVLEVDGSTFEDKEGLTREESEAYV